MKKENTILNRLKYNSECHDQCYEAHMEDLFLNDNVTKEYLMSNIERYWSIIGELSWTLGVRKNIFSKYIGGGATRNILKFRTELKKKYPDYEKRRNENLKITLNEDQVTLFKSLGTISDDKYYRVPKLLKSVGGRDFVIINANEDIPV